jgi:hypothetical protein
MAVMYVETKMFLVVLHVVMLFAYILYMGNSGLPPVVATHHHPTIGSFIGSMNSTTGITNLTDGMKQRLHAHHMQSPAQVTTPSDLLPHPPKRASYTSLLPEPCNTSNPNHHAMQPVHQTCSMHLNHSHEDTFIPSHATL